MSRFVYTPDEALVAVEMPPLEPVSALELSSGDCLVVCAGFEDRALGALQRAASLGVDFNVVIIEYQPFFGENKLEGIRRICHDLRLRTTELVYNRQDPAMMGASIVEQLRNHNGRVFLDVSAMSRLLIVQALVAIAARPDAFTSCFVVYTTANAYPPARHEAEAALRKCQADPTFSILFLSSGVFDITILPELSSSAPAAAQTRLIAFPSLDAHQLTALRAELQPSRCTLVEGVPPSLANRWRQQLISQINCLDNIQDAENAETSTLDYRETIQLLLRTYANHSVRERLILSPTGSKMQTVAAAIFRAFAKDVQIAYPTPHGFCRPDEYTIGIGQTYLLPLSSFSAPLQQSRHPTDSLS